MKWGKFCLQENVSVFCHVCVIGFQRLEIEIREQKLRRGFMSPQHGEPIWKEMTLTTRGIFLCNDTPSRRKPRHLISFALKWSWALANTADNYIKLGPSFVRENPGSFILWGVRTMLLMQLHKETFYSALDRRHFISISEIALWKLVTKHGGLITFETYWGK